MGGSNHSCIPIGTALVQEVQILHQQTEKRNDDALPLIGGAGRSPHGRFQCRPIAVEVAGRIHLVFQHHEFGRLNFGPLRMAGHNLNTRSAGVGTEVERTVFFRRDIGDMFRPAMMAIRLLKLPMLKLSRAVSIQYSMMRTRCFFLVYFIRGNTKTHAHTHAHEHTHARRD